MTSGRSPYDLCEARHENGPGNGHFSADYPHMCGELLMILAAFVLAVLRFFLSQQVTREHQVA